MTKKITLAALRKHTTKMQSGCHVWSGSFNKKGQPVISRQDVRSWLWNYEDRPPLVPGGGLLPQCLSPNCVNPGHMRSYKKTAFEKALAAPVEAQVKVSAPLEFNPWRGLLQN